MAFLMTQASSVASNSWLLVDPPLPALGGAGILLLLCQAPVGFCKVTDI